MRSRGGLVALIAAVSLLSACGGDQDSWTYGEVVQRDFDPAHVVHHDGHWRDGGQDCHPSYEYDWFSGEYRLKTRCTDRPDVWVPPWDEHVPDRWRILISEDSDGQDDDEEEHWVTVAEQVYDDCRIGRRYDRELEECPPR